MIIAFIAGLLVAGVGALLSIATNNWQVSFVISGTVAVISVVITSLFKNVSVISNKRSEIKKVEKPKAIDDIDAWGTVIAIVGIPNVIVTVWLFLKLYM
jgi:MFS family permease